MGKLAKPQKSNKHKKIKFVDPFYNGERKERMHAGKNLVPTNTEQGISRSVKDLMRRTQQAKELHKKSRRQKKEIMKKRILAQMSTDGAEREMTEVPSFQRKKGEKQADFMRRVDITTMNAVKESQIAATFKTELDPVTDEPHQKSTKKKEKLKMKKEMQKQKRKAKIEDRKDDFEQFKDEIQFGEVVHGLPSLSVRPKHADGNKTPAVKSLLLYDVIQKNKSEDQSQSAKKPSDQLLKSSKKSGKGTKRKLLSVARQREMDRERQTVIEMYRQMKQKNAGTG